MIINILVLVLSTGTGGLLVIIYEHSLYQGSSIERTGLQGWGQGQESNVERKVMNASGGSKNGWQS